VLTLFRFRCILRYEQFDAESKDPDPCLHLAIPYDLCLQTIGKEWLERQPKVQSIEERIKELEDRIKELQKG
jgi:hypothetical protein